MQSFTLLQFTGLALLITGIVLVSTNKDNEETRKLFGILCIVIGSLFLLSYVNILELLPKGSPHANDQFDMLGGKS
jgi:glucose uptake protein GlcU